MTISQDYAFKGIVALASISLSVNSWLVQEKVKEIGTDIKALSVSYQQLRIEGAVRDELLNNVRARLEVCELRAQKIEERVYAIDVRLAKGGG